MICNSFLYCDRHIRLPEPEKSLDNGHQIVFFLKNKSKSGIGT